MVGFRKTLSRVGAYAGGLVLSLAFALPCQAQVDVGTGLGPDIFTHGSQRMKKLSIASPFALAIGLVIDATTWNQISISTLTPVEEVGLLLRNGYYKLELLQLALMAKDAKLKLKDLVKRREKKESLRQIAKSHSIDYEPLYDKALELSERVDKRVESLMRVRVILSTSGGLKGHRRKKFERHKRE